MSTKSRATIEDLYKVPDNFKAEFVGGGVLETKRLILRQFTPEDATDNYRIYTDPENMKFMGRQPDSVEFEREHIRKHIINYYEKYGFGLVGNPAKRKQSASRALWIPISANRRCERD